MVSARSVSRRFTWPAGRLGSPLHIQRASLSCLVRARVAACGRQASNFIGFIRARRRNNACRDGTRDTGIVQVDQQRWPSEISCWNVTWPSCKALGKFSFRPRRGLDRSGAFNCKLFFNLTRPSQRARRQLIEICATSCRATPPEAEVRSTSAATPFQWLADWNSAHNGPS